MLDKDTSKRQKPENGIKNYPKYILTNSIQKKNSDKCGFIQLYNGLNNYNYIRVQDMLHDSNNWATNIFKNRRKGVLIWKCLEDDVIRFKLKVAISGWGIENFINVIVVGRDVLFFNYYG